MVAAIVRALSLSQNQAVPVNLIEQSLADARLLCATAGSLQGGIVLQPDLQPKIR
jgi:hypothetical protein